ncbi:hypothetical protein GW17_00042177 [Ensete ventricosum]|nr:hypothetical protein GW17_00042177 [Ensete ventricosum]
MTWSTDREGAATSSLDGFPQEPRGPTSRSRSINVLPPTAPSNVRSQSYGWNLSHPSQSPGSQGCCLATPSSHCTAELVVSAVVRKKITALNVLSDPLIYTEFFTSPLLSPVSTSPLLPPVCCAQRVMEGTRCGGGATCSSGVTKEGRKGGTKKPRHGRIKLRIFSELFRGILLLAKLIKNYCHG